MTSADNEGKLILELFSLSIRGREDDEAVLCTLNRTYNMRAVVVSNSYYVLTPPTSNESESGDAVIRGHVKQLLEITPSVAKLDSLRGLLRQSEYDGDDEKVSIRCQLV